MCALGRIVRRFHTCWSCQGTGVRWLAFGGYARRQPCPVCGGIGAVREAG